ASFNKLISMGNLQNSEFALINSAINELTLVGSSSAKVVYNQATGNLFYNPDGSVSGLIGGGQFATFNTSLNLAATDFWVQA
ncbi:MAG: calcium-binding protein, partial [Microcystaceae cyanobacterium]